MGTARMGRAERVRNGAPYLNFTGIAGEDQGSGVKSAFGRNLERLAEIKARCDPDNLFRLNNNIAPATGSGSRAP